MAHRLLLRLAACLILGSLFFDCEMTPAVSPTASSEFDASLLLPYQGRIRNLFEDGIDTAVFGAPNDRTGGVDPMLNERVRASVFVAVVQVTTVSDESYSKTGRLALELTPVEKAIYGSLGALGVAEEILRVAMSQGTGSYALLRSNQNDLIGKRLILCIGRFLEDGKPAIHWHAMEDSPKVRQAAVQAASMADLVN